MLIPSAAWGRMERVINLITRVNIHRYDTQNKIGNCPHNHRSTHAIRIFAGKIYDEIIEVWLEP